MEFSFLVLLLVGLVAGILAGLFGIGGGVLFTPILFLLFNEANISQPVIWTIGTSLFCTFIAATGSSIRQYRQHNFFWKEGVRVGLLGAVGVWVGKQVATAPFYTEEVFAIIFSLLFFYVAFMFIQRGRGGDKNLADDLSVIAPKQAGVTGGAGGFVAALAGIGGGSVMVPILNLYYRLSIQKAVSVSSLAIVLISLSGWVQLAFYEGTSSSLSGYALGVVDLGTALPLSIGGLVGGFVGAFINLKIRRQYLQFGFALLALVIVVKLLSDVF